MRLIPEVSFDEAVQAAELEVGFGNQLKAEEFAKKAQSLFTPRYSYSANKLSALWEKLNRPNLAKDTLVLSKQMQAREKELSDKALKSVVNDARLNAQVYF